MREIDLHIPIERHGSVESTGLIARRAVQSCDLSDQPRLFLAETQTAGVGRFGREWASPRGGLWGTLVWPLTLNPERALDGLGLRLGLACVHAIDHELAAHGCGARVQLKWPNDVLLAGKKVLGLLTEVMKHNGRTYVLVGVGINGDFCVVDLPPAIRPGATTLRDVIGREPNMTRLIDDLRVRLREALMEEGLGEHVLAEARERLFGIGANVTIRLGDGSIQTGVLKGLDAHGRLMLDQNDGEWTAPPGAELAVLSDRPRRPDQ